MNLQRNELYLKYSRTALTSINRANLISDIDNLKPTIENIDVVRYLTQVLSWIRQRDPRWLGRFSIGRAITDGYLTATVNDGEGALTSDDVGRMKYTEDATPDGAFGVHIALSSGYIADFSALRAWLNNQDVAVTINVVLRDGNNATVRTLITESLDSSGKDLYAESTGRQPVFELGEDWDINWSSAAEIDASTIAYLYGMVNIYEASNTLGGGVEA